MADHFVLDTHGLVWYLEGHPRLGAGALSAIQQPGNRLFVPVIALAEACWMVEHGRLAIPSVTALLADLDAAPRITVVPLAPDATRLGATLTALDDMHDRLIVATALLLATGANPVVLITRDVAIQQSGLVPTLW